MKPLFIALGITLVVAVAVIILFPSQKKCNACSRHSVKPPVKPSAKPSVSTTNIIGATAVLGNTDIPEMTGGKELNTADAYYRNFSVVSQRM